MTKTTKRRLAILVAIVLVVSVSIFALVQVKQARKAAEQEQARAEAMEAYEAGDYETALPLFSRVVRRDSATYEEAIAFATARAAVPQENGRHIGQAITLAELAEDRDPRALEPKELLLRLYAQVGYAEELIETANAALAIEPDHYRAMAALPSAHLSRSEDEEALEAAEAFAVAHPNDLAAQRLHVGLLLQRGSSDRAILEKLREMETRLGDTPEVLIVRASAMLELDRVDEAIALIRRTLDESPTDAGIMFQLLTIAQAVVSRDPALIGEAEAYLDKIVADAALDSDFVTLAYERYWQSERPEAVLRSLRERLDQIDQMSDTAAGYALLSALELDQATLVEEVRDELESRESRAASDWLTVAKAFNGLEREVVTRDLETRTAHEVMRYLRGLFYRSIGEREMAERQWGSLASDPQWGRARLALADLLLSQDRYREARGVVGSDRRTEKTARQLLLLADATLRIIERGEPREGDYQYARSLLEIIRGSDVSGATFDAIAGRLALATDQDELAREYAQRLIDEGVTRDPRSVIQFASQLESTDAALMEQMLGGLETEGGEALVSVVLSRAERLYDAGQRDEARRVIEEAIEASAGAGTRELRRALGRMLTRAWPEEATAHLIAVANDYPDHTGAQRDLLEHNPSWSEREEIAKAIDRLKEQTGEASLAWRLYDARYALAGGADEKAASGVVLNLTKVLQVDEDNADAMLLLSDAYRRLGNEERAVVFLERALDAADNPRRIYPVLIRNLLQQGKMRQARDRLFEFASMGELAPEVLRIRANLLEDQSMMELALDDRGALAELGEPSDIISLAGTYAQMGRDQDARATLERLDAIETLPAREKIRVAGLYESMDDREMVDEVLATLPEDSEIGPRALVLSDFYLRTGRVDEGSAMLRRAGEDADDVDTWVGIAEIYRATGFYDEARDALASARALDASDPRIATLAQSVEALASAIGGGSGVSPELGEIVFDVDRSGLGAIVEVLSSDDPSEAAARLTSLTRQYSSDEMEADAFIDRLSRLASENPRHYPSWRVLLHAQAKDGRMDDALATARTMVQAFPSDHRPAQMATTLLALRNSVDEALAMARLWRERQLASPKRASLVIALLQLELDRADEAITTLDPWASEVRANPGDDPRVAVLLAEALASTGDVRGAYELLRPISGSDALPWEAALAALEAGSSEGQAYESVLRELDGAGSVNEESFALPMAQAWYRVALRTGSEAALRSAMEYAKSVFDSSESDRRVLGASVVLAGVSYRLGSTPDAIRYYRQALEIAPDSPDMLNNLAYMLLEEGGDPRESIDLAMRAISINEEANSSTVALRDYYDTLGLAYSRAGEHARAEEAYRAALDLAPDNNAFRTGLVESLIEQGKLEEAAQAFEPLRGLPDDSPLHDRVRALESRLGG